MYRLHCRKIGRTTRQIIIFVFVYAEKFKIESKGNPLRLWKSGSQPVGIAIFLQKILSIETKNFYFYNSKKKRWSQIILLQN